MANTTKAPQDGLWRYKLQSFLTQFSLYLVLTIGAIIAIFPFIWMAQTSFKTYGEHGARKFWPAALTASPYLNRPATKRIEVPMHETDAWRNVPRSFSAPIEGVFLVDEVPDYIAQKVVEAEKSLPLEVMLLAIDSTDDGVQNYDRFFVSVDSRIIQQFSTRMTGKEMGGPNYFAADRGRWGPHYRVLDANPEHFIVEQSWNIWFMLFHNYILAWKDANFSLYMWNSVRITVITVIGTLITSVLAAYAFARMKFPGKDFIFGIYLATYMIPGAVTLIPNYLIVLKLDEFFESTLHMPDFWIDNWAGLTIPFMINAFSVFLLRQFFAQIPDELYEASIMDGCGHLRFLSSVVLSLSKAPLMSVIMFNMIWAWNQLQWPLLVTNVPDWRPITVGLDSFITEAAAQSQLTMAGAVITTIPILVLYFFTQKQFTEGIATTGLKG
ncbi:MAG: carbohydrate ABC transporter permease [Anaerolineae bacterium]|nr:carbohydrate ABC transporter permease [Anaerolineae bacterium]